MAGRHRGPNKNQRTVPVMKTGGIRLTLESEEHAEIYLMAYREERSLANMASVLIREALVARRSSRPPYGCDCGTPGNDLATHSHDCAYRRTNERDIQTS